MVNNHWHLDFAQCLHQPFDYAQDSPLGGGGSFTKFNHLTILHIISIDNKPDEGAHFVPALHTGGAGIHMQALQFIVEHDL
jgi:hypothetical protein